MRPIEFRAWDEDGYMFTPTKITWGTFGDKKSIEVWNGHIFGTLGSGVVALMQFTGLLDSRGQKIFEGDLLQQELYGGLKSRLQEVFWNEAGFYLRPSTPYGNTPLDAFRASVTEVVGNVWANTDLLAAPPQPVKDKE